MLRRRECRSDPLGFRRSSWRKSRATTGPGRWTGWSRSLFLRSWNWGHDLTPLDRSVWSADRHERRRTPVRRLSRRCVARLLTLWTNTSGPGGRCRTSICPRHSSDYSNRIRCVPPAQGWSRTSFGSRRRSWGRPLSPLASSASSRLSCPGDWRWFLRPTRTQ